MQADEDVGKVAQATPVAVSKALELFMITLVSKAASEARLRNSKRVTSSHLKAAIKRDDVLDFLADIISKVPDALPPASTSLTSSTIKREDEGVGGAAASASPGPGPGGVHSKSEMDIDMDGTGEQNESVGVLDGDVVVPRRRRGGRRKKVEDV
ncbi:DR1-associated protein 1 (negative cofactor 2 alpha) [Ascosphaera aggregata]|nr:DR1-associated protein 1 (negative cofactor 2 alpha) [Ascosphaera aggregata]